MSKELSSAQIDRAVAAVYVLSDSVDTAQDAAMSLLAHIEWLDEQLQDRDERITELENEIEELEDTAA